MLKSNSDYSYTLMVPLIYKLVLAIYLNSPAGRKSGLTGTLAGKKADVKKKESKAVAKDTKKKVRIDAYLRNKDLPGLIYITLSEKIPTSCCLFTWHHDIMTIISLVVS